MIRISPSVIEGVAATLLLVVGMTPIQGMAAWAASPGPISGRHNRRTLGVFELQDAMAIYQSFGLAQPLESGKHKS